MKTQLLDRMAEKVTDIVTSYYGDPAREPEDYIQTAVEQVLERFDIKPDHKQFDDYWDALYEAGWGAYNHLYEHDHMTI